MEHQQKAPKEVPYEEIIDPPEEVSVRWTGLNGEEEWRSGWKLIMIRHAPRGDQFIVQNDESPLKRVLGDHEIARYKIVKYGEQLKAARTVLEQQHETHAEVQKTIVAPVQKEEKEEMEVVFDADDPVLLAEIEALAEQSGEWDATIAAMRGNAEELVHALEELTGVPERDPAVLARVHALLPNVYHDAPNAADPVAMRKAFAKVINKVARLDEKHMLVYRQLMDRIPKA
jgi:hypothetical protein